MERELGGHRNEVSNGGIRHAGAKRAFDIAASVTLLILLAPLVVVTVACIVLDSPGRPFYRAERVGRGGRTFRMLKFRKMRHGSSGPALTAPVDERFTRIGRLLAQTKLDELPQLWNVLVGDMSFVGPRPEDPSFVDLFRDEFAPVLVVRPGITGYSQLAFARESEILDPDDRVGDYIRRVLPQKLRLDTMYVGRAGLTTDLQVLFWTAAAVLGRRDVAVHRGTGRLRRRAPRIAPATMVTAHVR
jgi:lipopolysaccharide/colanic/teichoic acid biosynthesis glycosyltransferase